MAITNLQFAQSAVNAIHNPPFNDKFISYKEEDCQKFVKETIRRAGGKMKSYAGSNDMFRNACQCVYKISDPKAKKIMVKGALLFIVEEGWNTKYNDSLGNASHVGILTLDPQAEAMHSSASRGGVYPTKIANGFNYVGLIKEDTVTYKSTAGNEYGGQGGELEMGDMMKPEIQQGTERPFRITLPDGKKHQTVNFRKEPNSDIVFAYLKEGDIIQAGDAYDYNGKLWRMGRFEGKRGHVWAEFTTELDASTETYQPDLPVYPVPPEQIITPPTSFEGRLALLEDKVEYILKEIGSKYYKERK